MGVSTDTGHTRSSRSGDWTKQRKIGRQRVGRSILGKQVKAVDEAWMFARSIGLPLNRFLSVRIPGIDNVPAERRSALWSRYRNRLAQFARDNRFAFTCVCSRESEPGTGNKEHMHVVMHVPPKLQDQFDAMVDRWSQSLDDEYGLGGGGSNSTAIDCRPSTYRTRRTTSGKKRNVITYITKNSPQAAWTKERSFQRGGPIVGKRCGMTRNLDQGCIMRQQQKLRAAAASRTAHRERITNYDTIISKTPAVTAEVASGKFAGNSNYLEFSKGEVA